MRPPLNGINDLYHFIHQSRTAPGAQLRARRATESTRCTSEAERPHHLPTQVYTRRNFSRPPRIIRLFEPPRPLAEQGWLTTRFGLLKTDMKKTLFATTALAFTLAGCASAPTMGNVIPEAGDHYQAIGLGSSSDAALTMALYTAENTCKPRHMRHVVTGQQTQYRGVLSENASRAVDTLSQTVSSLAHAWVPTLSRNDDYQITLSFTCAP